MRGRRFVTFVLAVLLISLVIGPVLVVPALAEPAGMVKGSVKGTWLFYYLDGSTVQGEFQYRWNIIQAGEPDGDGCAAAKGWATFDGRLPGNIKDNLKVAVDCVKFLTIDGKPAAIYSGKIVKSENPETDWTGELKIGMVIDDGDALSGDKIIFWWPLDPTGTYPTGQFFPDNGVALHCTVPDNSMELDAFTLTEGDIEVRY